MGLLEGVVEDGLQVFRAVPYAAVPSGELRWQPPHPVKPWPGSRRCDRFGAVSIQADPSGGTGYTGDFDCLHLNVWRPADDAVGLPVMVWIPGGGFIRGGASDGLYDGSAMARHGIVFVSVGYRVGVDGFMHFEDAAPNRGLQDVMAALSWVREHIACFGGDPGRVTVAGVSAGAGAIAHILGTSAGGSLISRAILQSPSLQAHSLDDAERIRAAIAGVLGVAPDRAAIDRVPLNRLTRALQSFLGNADLKRRWGVRPRNHFPVRPVIDGRFLKEDALTAIRSRLREGDFLPPAILGCNAEEMRFFLVPGGDLDRIGANQLRDFVRDIGWPENLSSDHLPTDEILSPGERLCRIQSDYYYRLPVAELARVLCDAGSETWCYEFGWQSPLCDGQMRAAHAMEIPFVLGNLGLPRAQSFTGAAGPCALGDEMHEFWARFVRSLPMHPWASGCQGLRVFK